MSVNGKSWLWRKVPLTPETPRNQIHSNLPVFQRRTTAPTLQNGFQCRKHWHTSASYVTCDSYQCLSTGLHDKCGRFSVVGQVTPDGPVNNCTRHWLTASCLASGDGRLVPLTCGEFRVACVSHFGFYVVLLAIMASPRTQARRVIS